MAAVAVPRMQRQEPQYSGSFTTPWRPLADALISSESENILNIGNYVSSSNSETYSDYNERQPDIEIDSASEVSEFEVFEAEDEADDVYDALTCDYDLVLTPGTATPSPCATPLRTPKSSPLEDQIAAAAITRRLKRVAISKGEEVEEENALDMLKACCVSCVHGLQALTSVLIGESHAEAEVEEELVEVVRPGAKVHFLVSKRQVEAGDDEEYELGEDEFGMEDME